MAVPTVGQFEGESVKILNFLSLEPEVTTLMGLGNPGREQGEVIFEVPVRRSFLRSCLL